MHITMNHIQKMLYHLLTKTEEVLPIWVYVVAVLVITSPEVFSSAVNSTTADFWQDQYNAISQEIMQTRDGLGKKTGTNTSNVCDQNALIWESDRNPTDVILRRTEALLTRYSQSKGTGNWGHFIDRLNRLKRLQKESSGSLSKKTVAATSESTSLYNSVQALNREIMLANPELDFTDLIFIERDIVRPGSEIDGDHMCDQYYGHNARTGGGMFILKNYASNPQKVDIMEGLTVPDGTNKGKRMSEGTFLSPDLSFDGETIVFAWSSGGRTKWRQENRFNIFSVNVDGTNLQRLTDGNHDDIHPCWLPGGRIVFISTRRGGYGRCHGRSVPTYTLHSMKPDGSDLIRLSHHETNEWHPSVANDGSIIYSRWDYIDRDFSAAHHLWFCNPDGTNPRSWGGNYSLPLNTLGNGPFRDERGARPWAEFNGRSVPGAGSKVVATAGPHHGQAFGSLILRDYNVPDDNKMAQVTRLTPDAAFPEGSTAWRSGYVYGTPWPLSEDSYICSYHNSIILLDQSGSKQELYKSRNLRPIYPIPLRSRTTPPTLSVKTYQGERWNEYAPRATIDVSNVYITDDYGKLPEGVKIKSMRIIQVLVKSTPIVNQPRIGYGSENSSRMVLGTVPVESDGSVNCEAPIGKPIYFQLLDENGMAVQSMRSVTYVHEGERLSCVGCHEDKWEAPPSPASTMALNRVPSEIDSEVNGVEPTNFYRLVKPVFDKKCQPCHAQKGKGPRDMSYRGLEPYAFYFMGSQSNTVPHHGGSRTTPGKFGSHYARMGKAMLSNTHVQAREDNKFTEEDMRRVTLWLDCASDEFGAYHDINGQRAGKLVWPEFDVDPDNPTGVDTRDTIPVSIVEKNTSFYRLFVSALDQSLHLPLSFAKKPITITILDLNGRLVQEIKMNGNSEMLPITLDHFGRGLYFIRCRAGNETITQRIVRFR